MSPCLAIDIGGTKTLAALITGKEILDQREIPTARSRNAAFWCDNIADMTRDWLGHYEAAGAAVTGAIEDGRWTALNPSTLPIDAGFPLSAELQRRLGTRVACHNDAQAAAWGEFRFGAGEACDLVFLTISTGIGGGAVFNGKLLTGAHGNAASAGQLRYGNGRWEDQCSGLWMAAEAARAGYAMDAAGVFAAASRGQGWADAIIATSAHRIAELIFNLHMLFDPPLFVIGGGIGLAPGFLDRLRSGLAGLMPDKRPELRAAALGKHAGVIGVADLAAALS